MRKLIIFVALFMLLSVPAFAADNCQVDVDIDVSDCWTMTCSSGTAIDFTIACTQWDDGYCHATGDPTVMEIKSTKDWNLKVKHDNPTGWSKTGWDMWTDEGAQVANDHSGAHEITDLDTWYYASNQSATNDTDLSFYYMIDGIDWADDWDAHTDMTITWTLGQKP